jgi:hypothetical protein
VGSILLQPVLHLCDEQQIPAYLETATEQNLPFYARHGFQVRDVIEMPQAGPTLWTMWRDYKKTGK